MIQKPRSTVQHPLVLFSAFHGLFSVNTDISQHVCDIRVSIAIFLSMFFMFLYVFKALGRGHGHLVSCNADIVQKLNS
jgi:hypothetical protein